MEPYTDTNEHLRDELRRIDMLLERAIAQFRGTIRQRADSPYAGLYISDAEADGLLETATSATGDERVVELSGAIGTLTAEIAARLEMSRLQGIPLRTLHLAEAFGLGRRELDAIMLAFAPEIDVRYQKLYAYVQDDVLRKRPTVELALRLLCEDEMERIAARRLFSDVSPLFAIPLLTRHEDPSDRPAPLLNTTLKLEERVVEFLVGGDYLESRFARTGRALRWVRPTRTLESLVLPEETAATIRSVAGAMMRERRWLCGIHGPAGGGKKAVAEAICALLGVPMLIVNLSAVTHGEGSARGALRSVMREARLYGGALYVDGWPTATSAEQPTAGAEAAVMLLEELDAFPGPVFIGSRAQVVISTRMLHSVVTLELRTPDEDQRMELWTSALERSGMLAPGTVDTRRLAGAYRLTPGRMENAIGRARAAARLRNAEAETMLEEDLLQGCREESSGAMITFARKIVPRRGWDDLVLPADVSAQLHELCRQVRHRATVYGAWGFRRKLSMGIGTIALFTGTSGTGKTLSAEVIAAELGVDLYRIDLSSIVSKYIGETEKNLEKVFGDAQDSSAILFFDEADALFGKRSDVKDAHDRYANIEVNYLLQRVEEYEGAIILASNLSRNIDAAFVRRLHFSIEFPFPDERYRQEIWRRIFPTGTPLSDDIDLPFLARQFKVAGGNIRNVALAAAFHAAEAGGAISMERLILAMKREYQKLGKTCERTDFQQYYELVR